MEQGGLGCCDALLPAGLLPEGPALRRPPSPSPIPPAPAPAALQHEHGWHGGPDHCGQLRRCCPRRHLRCGLASAGCGLGGQLRRCDAALWPALRVPPMLPPQATPRLCAFLAPQQWPAATAGAARPSRRAASTLCSSAPPALRCCSACRCLHRAFRNCTGARTQEGCALSTAPSSSPATGGWKVMRAPRTPSSCSHSALPILVGARGGGCRSMLCIRTGGGRACGSATLAAAAQQHAPGARQAQLGKHGLGEGSGQHQQESKPTPAPLFLQGTNSIDSHFFPFFHFRSLLQLSEGLHLPPVCRHPQLAEHQPGW